MRALIVIAAATLALAGCDGLMAPKGGTTDAAATATTADPTQAHDQTQDQSQDQSHDQSQGRTQ